MIYRFVSMNRGLGRLPLHSLLLRHLRRHIPVALPLPLPLVTSKPTIPVPQILTRHFSSKKTIDEQLSQQQNPFFPSLKCYTRDDPDTPYYVIECPPLLQKEANEGKRGCSLPEEMQLSCNIEHIECETCDLYLVGVHSSDQKSIQDVEDIINHLKPEVIFLELCASRSAALQKLQDDNKNQAQNRVFPVAFEVAIQNGTKVVLGDRPFHITVRKILEGMLAMRLWEFTKLSFYLLLRFIEYGKDNKTFNINDFVLKKLEDLKTFSTLKQPTILERDLYMSSVLTKVADEHSLVVAFIGSDHVYGIKKHLQQTIAINLSEKIPDMDEVHPSKV